MCTRAQCYVIYQYQLPMGTYYQSLIHTRVCCQLTVTFTTVINNKYKQLGTTETNNPTHILYKSQELGEVLKELLQKQIASVYFVTPHIHLDRYQYCPILRYIVLTVKSYVALGYYNIRLVLPIHSL